MTYDLTPPTRSDVCPSNFKKKYAELRVVMFEFDILRIYSIFKLAPVRRLLLVVGDISLDS